MHTLFTDLLILMPMKVKEMRNYADDAAKVDDEVLKYYVYRQIKINFRS